jgi:cytidylate kinase
MSSIQMNRIPVITIDGPTASGKGTVASRVAQTLGFAFLDSGALYRLTALAATESGMDLGDEPELARIAAGLDVRFEGERILLSGREVSDAIRAEAARWWTCSMVFVEPPVWSRMAGTWAP